MGKPSHFPNWRRYVETQPTIKGFYDAAFFYLALETISLLGWVVQMICFKFCFDPIATGDGYRLANTLALFHLGTPLAVVNVIQQSRNNNSALLWIFFVFFIGYASDLESCLGLWSGAVPNTVSWAHTWLYVTTSVNLLLTFLALSIFVYWFIIKRPSGIPLPYADVMYDAAREGRGDNDAKAALLQHRLRF